MFTYDPITEEQAMRERYQLLPDGEYDGVIEKAEARVSGSGNPMIDTTITVYDKQGRTHSIRDFLVFTPNMQWKAIHCAKSCGLEKEYEEKKFCPEIMVKKNVRVLLGSQTGKVIPTEKLNGKAPGALYPDKNVIEDYLARNGETVNKVTAQDDFISDDIPF